MRFRDLLFLIVLGGVGFVAYQQYAYIQKLEGRGQAPAASQESAERNPYRENIREIEKYVGRREQAAQPKPSEGVKSATTRRVTCFFCTGVGRKEIWLGENDQKGPNRKRYYGCPVCVGAGTRDITLRPGAGTVCSDCLGMGRVPVPFDQDANQDHGIKSRGTWCKRCQNKGVTSP